MRSTSDSTRFNNAKLDKIIKLALDKKAQELIVLDVRKQTTITDYFIICSGNSDPQMKAISDNIRKGTAKKPHHIEGYENKNWILLDYFEIIVHIFKRDDRQYYNLEGLWSDAPINKYFNEEPKNIDKK